MKIKSKLLTIFLLIALIPIAIVSFISIYSFYSVLERSIGENFAHTAKEKAASIEYIISERIAEVKKLAALPQVKELLREKNSDYRSLPQSVAKKKIMALDVEWIKSGGKSDFADRIRNNELSEFFREYQRTAPEKYGEIFLTCRVGTTVAMTGTLSDYFQGDEQWWLESFSNGKGRTFLDYRGFDKSVGTLTLGVVSPVMDGSEVIGILKVNYKIKEILDVISSISAGKTFESFLVNSQGDIVAYKGSFPKRDISDKERNLLNKAEMGWEEDSYDGRKTIHAFSSVKSKIFTRIAVPGARKGISGEKWVPSKWYVFLEIERDEAFASIRSIRNILILVGCLIGIAVILIAIFISKAISGPIEALTKSVIKVGRGEDWQEIETQSSDEIGVLSGAFNEMVAELSSTTVSLDRLTKEVEERKRAEEELKSEKEYLEKLHNTLGEVIFTIKIPERVIESVNPSVQTMFGYSPQECIGKTTAFLYPEGGAEEFGKKLKSVMDKGVELLRTEHKFKRKNNEIFQAGVTTTFLREAGEITRVISIIRDITAQKLAEKQIKASLKEKEVLLKEIHHRVKNNLQVVSSMLNLQTRQVENKELQGILQESQDRIRSMALVHEQLYESKDISNISFSRYLKALTANIFKSYTHSPSRVELKIEVEEIRLDIDTSIVLGLILNELCTNVLKHAFPKGRRGELRVEFARLNNDSYILSIGDNGVGLPKDFEIDKAESMGFLLVKGMVTQLDGTMEVDQSTGTSFKIIFPRKSAYRA